MLEVDETSGANVDALELLNETIRCFGPMFNERELQSLQKKLMEIADHPRSGAVAKKKAITSMSNLSVYLTDTLLNQFVSSSIESFNSGDLELWKRRLLFTMLGSIARSVPRKLGPHLKNLVPFVLDSLSQDEYLAALENIGEDIDPMEDEVKEAALIALDDFLSSCVNEMRPFTELSIEAAIRYLNYDPMMASQSDEEMGGTQEDEDEEEIDFGADDDEDYEAEETLSDDDDTSWKVRKCAAKVLYALISTRGADLVDNGTLYERIAPSLVKRFNEREENVRLEILVTVALLVKKTSEVVPSSNFAVEVVDHVPAAHSAKSRKRRRGSSDEAMLEDPAYSRGNMSPALSPSPTYGPRAELGRIGPSIFKGVIKLFGQKSVPTRQAATMLLKEFVLAKHGCLTDELTQIMDPVMETIKTPSTSALGSMASSAGGLSSATGNSLRIESLQFICVLCDTHSSKVLVPHLNKIVPSLITAVNDNYFKIACEAIDATESVVKALTPPRALGSDGTSKNYVEAMFDAVLEKARNSSADLEVRQRAIHALGICLARTLGGSRLLSPSKREQGLVALNERLKGETTRLASVQALDHLMTSLTRKDEFQPAWAESVAVELSNQLRKADRRLRGASLVGMKRLSANHVVLESLGEPTVQTMTAQILPLLDDSNLSHLTLGIEVLTEMIRKFPQTVASEKLFDALCRVVVATLGRHALEAFLSLVDVIGAQRVGKPLMQMFLQVGVNGDSAIVGRAIGALVVSGGSTVGVSTLDFQKELQTAQDDKRKCLALAILGEIALRRGSQSDLDPSIFLQHFTSKSELVSRLAAISLGRAAAGNVPTYLPIILSTIKQSGSTQFLLLHSIRETLQNANKARTELSQFTGAIWSHLLEISGSEDNKVVGAECVGRLAGFEPKKYLPLLQVRLRWQSSRCMDQSVLTASSRLT